MTWLKKWGWCILGILLLGWYWYTHSGPQPPPVVNSPLLVPPDSYLAFPVETPVEVLRTRLEKDLKQQPVASGATPELTGTYLALATVKMVKVNTLLHAAYDTVVRRDLAQRIVAGIITGGGSELVRVTVPAVYGPVAALDDGTAAVANILEHYTTPMDRTFSVRYVINYTVNVEKVESLSIVGNKLSATVVFDWNLSADIHAPKILGAGIIDAAIPGAATTRGVTAVSVSATLTVTDNGALKINVDDKGVGIDLRSLKIPNLNVDLSGPLNPVIVQSKIATSLAIRNLPFAQQLLQQNIDNQQSNLTFGDRIRESLAKLGRPISAGKNFYVDICPTSLGIGNPQGVQENGQSMLMLPVEIKTPVRLIASGAPPKPFPGATADNLPIIAANPTANLFDIQLVADMPWKDLAASVDNAINKFWNEQPTLAGLFTPGPVTMWETTGNKVAFAIPILKKNQQKTWVTLYGSGDLDVAQTADPATPENFILQEISLSHFQWTDQTQYFLIHSVLSAINAPVAILVQKTAHRKLDDLEKQINDYKDKTWSDDPVTTTHLQLVTHKFEALTISGEYLRVCLHVKGRASLTLKSL